MFICCWSSKGGAGTTVVATALAVLLGRTSPGGAVLADLAGDAPYMFGCDSPLDGGGLAAWLASGDAVPADALARLEVPVGRGVSLLPRGQGALSPGRADVLAALLAADRRPVVADVGVLHEDDVGLTLAGAATHSLLVLRSCYLSLRHAVHGRLRPSGVVLVQDEGRGVTETEVERTLGVPVKAVVRVHERVARAVDSGEFAARFPRSLARDLRHAA